MAHWAKLDSSNQVIQIIVTDNNDPNNDEGYQWIVENIGGRWVQTSYNSFGGVHYLPDDQRDEDGNKIPSGRPHLRYNYAGVGYTYDEINDAFIPPKPELLDGKNYILNTQTFQWDVEE